MIYQPLNRGSNEIRVFSFYFDSIPGSSDCLTSQSLLDDRIYCNLENVSLDAVSPSYREFLSTPNSSSWEDSFCKIISYRECNIKKGVAPSVQTWRPPEAQAPSDSEMRRSRYLWGDFEALSYSWGESKATRTVIINNQAMEVSENLHAALRELRELPETGMGMRYWADALCIDQANVSEKNHQVKLMKDIYPKARSVIVWLGEASKTENNAIDLINQIYNDEFKSENELGLILDLDLHRRFGRDSWRALYHFLKMRYWQRLWIIQELALNHESTLILCGKRKLCRALIQSVVSICNDEIDAISEIIQASSASRDEQLQDDIWKAAFRVSRLISLQPKTELGSDLDRILDLTRRSKTSDDKDKVYGILGIIHPSISSLVNPDYALSLEAVYKNFAVSLVRATRRLDILFGWTEPLLTEPWPSWIPDWRKSYDRNHLQHLQNHFASGSSVATIRFFDDNKCLICTGFKADVIDGTSSRFVTKSGVYIEPMLQPTKNKNPYSKDIQDAFWQTLTLGRDFSRRQISRKLLPSLKNIPWSVPTISQSETNKWNTSKIAHYAKFHQFCEANKEFLICGRPLRSLFDHANEHNDDAEQLAFSVRFVALTLMGRRLITTLDGYLGLAPESAQHGDLIAVVHGCNFPVVLRQYGSRYRLVGECYLHGFMNDEISMMEKEGKRFVEKFEIV